MRYIILLASVVVQVCLGGLYAWSSLVPALQTSYGLSAAQSQLVFGTLIAVFTAAMVFAGRLLLRRGPRLVAGIGGVLFGAGYLLASFSEGSFLVLLLGIGVVAGIGTGFGYVCPLATGMKWFPDHKGLVTGVAVAGFGAGAVLLSALVETLLAVGMDVLVVLRWIGIGYGVAIVAASLVLRFPPHHVSARVRPIPRLGVLIRDPVFGGLAIGMFCGTFAGLLVIGNLKPLALSMGTPPVEAALTISVFAAGNACGRIAWGWLADRIERWSIFFSLAFLAASLGLLGFAAGSSTGVLLASFLVGFGFGACFTVYAAQVASRYGADRVGGVYPLVFLAYGAAGIAGPSIGGWLYDLTSSYSSGLAVAAGIAVVGLFACVYLLRDSTCCTVSRQAQSCEICGRIVGELE